MRLPPLQDFKVRFAEPLLELFFVNLLLITTCKYLQTDSESRSSKQLKATWLLSAVTLPGKEWCQDAHGTCQHPSEPPGRESS